MTPTRYPPRHATYMPIASAFRAVARVIAAFWRWS